MINQQVKDTRNLMRLANKLCRPGSFSYVASLVAADALDWVLNGTGDFELMVQETAEFVGKCGPKHGSAVAAADNAFFRACGIKPPSECAGEPASAPKRPAFRNGHIDCPCWATGKYVRAEGCPHHPFDL